MDVEIFIANVKARCKALGTTPTVACIESGAGKNLITNIKKGTMPSIDKVQMLAKYLGVTTSELLGEGHPIFDHPENAHFFDKYNQLTPAERQLSLERIERIIKDR